MLASTPKSIARVVYTKRGRRRVMSRSVKQRVFMGGGYMLYVLAHKRCWLIQSPKTVYMHLRRGSVYKVDEFQLYTRLE